MNKKPFKDIEQIIKNAAEAYEPAFDEQAWLKMEVLLDKDKDRKKPAFFWLWLLLSLLTVSGVIGYFVFTKNDKTVNRQDRVVQKSNQANTDQTNNTKTETADKKNNATESDKINPSGIAGEVDKNTSDKKVNLYKPVFANSKRAIAVSQENNKKNTGGDIVAKNKFNEKVKGKMTVKIKSAEQVSDNEEETALTEKKIPGISQVNSKDSLKADDMVVIKVDAENPEEKEVKKVIDTAIEKLVKEVKAKNRNARIYIIAAAGTEGNGVKLFAADKITARVGLSVGYQINKNVSVQAGFFASNKKYIAGSGDYKTKPGTYWNVVDIKSIDANCRVYEIPLIVRYDFTPDKKIQAFASAGISSYIMQKEDYQFYYDRYGTAHQADAYYKGNKNLFSVLRLSAGIEKKIAKQFSLNISPGVAIPLKGVGEGEVKLYSTDLTIGLKFTPQRKNKK